MASKIFKKAKEEISQNSTRFIENSFEVIEYIHGVLKSRGLNQKDLAEKLDKSESEISKILSPGHNITLKTISKIEVALEEKIIMTPKNINKKEPITVVYIWEQNNKRCSNKSNPTGEISQNKNRAYC